jgi:hypothetical protein
LSGDRQLARFFNTVGAGWSSAPAGGCGTGVDVGGTAGDSCPVPDAGISSPNHAVYQRRPATITPNTQNFDDPKISIWLKDTAIFRKLQNLPELRSQAEICFQRSELTADRSAKLRWFTLAEAWLLMADNMAERDLCDDSGVSDYQYLQREDEGALSKFLIGSKANRRKYRRQRVFKEGKITDPELKCVTDVIIRDLSESGARVQLAASHALPDDLGLYVVSERLLYPAVARWRKEEALGIQFVGPPRPTALCECII